MVAQLWQSRRQNPHGEGWVSVSWGRGYNEGGMEQEMGGWTRVASAVIRTLLQSRPESQGELHSCRTATCPQDDKDVASHIFKSQKDINPPLLTAEYQTKM